MGCPRSLGTLPKVLGSWGCSAPRGGLGLCDDELGATSLIIVKVTSGRSMGPQEGLQLRGNVLGAAIEADRERACFQGGFLGLQELGHVIE